MKAGVVAALVNCKRQWEKAKEIGFKEAKHYKPVRVPIMIILVINPLHSPMNPMSL